MKAGVKPELTKKWWDKNKALTLRNSDVGDALLRFETAKIKGDGKAYLKAIADLEGKIVAALKQADAKAHAETIQGLHAYTAQLGDERKQAMKRIEQDKNPAPPPQKFGRPDVIWQADVAKQVTSKIDPAWLESFRDCRLRLAVDDQLVATMRNAGEAAVLAFMVSDAQKVADAVTAELIKRVERLDDNSNRSPQEMDKARGELTKDVEKLLAKAEVRLKAIPDERWKLFLSRQKQYKDYKVRSAVQVATGVVGVTASAAGIVGTGGTGLALGIVALTRSAVQLVQKVYELSIEADTVGTKLEKSCAVLQARYADAKKQAGNEVGATLVRGLLGENAFMDAIPEAQASLKLWSDKVAGLSGAVQDAAQKIVDAIEKTGELEKRIERAQTKEARAAYAELTKLQEALDKMLSSTSELGGSISRFEEACPRIAEFLAGLRARNDKHVERFEKVFPALVKTGLAGANAANGFAAARTAMQYAKTSVTLTNEIRQRKKEWVEAIG